MLKLLSKIKNERSLLEDEEKRKLYLNLISQIKGNTIDKKKLFDIYNKKSINNKILRSCNNIINLAEKGFISHGFEFMWELYEYLASGNISEQLAQYFTSSEVAAFTLSSFENPSKILDPMAGHGAFLKIAEKVFPKSDSIIGVDIDNLPLKSASLILDDRVRLVNKDLFSWTLENVTIDPSFSFDAIIGNPAYVSYQGLQAIGNFAKREGDYRVFLMSTLKKISKLK